MSGIAIYLEGGGDAARTKRGLRRGMDRFLRNLKDAARRKHMYWSVVPCGSRQRTFAHWSKAPNDPRYPIRVLLVDAEGPVHDSGSSHLAVRDDWRVPDDAEERVHLMVQTMETWIVADPAAVGRYYGQRFARSALPAAGNRETVEKARLEKALIAATGRTQKGVYHKTRHSPELLALIDPEQVRARCPACERLFAVVGGLIQAA